MKQPHEILGIEADADDATARRAFLKKARVFHPDVSELDPITAHQLFQRLNAAYDAFRHPEKPNEWNRPPAPIIVYASQTFDTYRARMAKARDFGPISKRSRRVKKTIGIFRTGRR
ncbi:MAG: J domain-containing protein [Bacteroidota bacterium]